MIFPPLLFLLILFGYYKTEDEKEREAKEKLPFKGAQMGEQYVDRYGNTKVRTGYFDYDN